MPPKLDNDDFIRKSKIIHKDFYDYSKCEYDNSTSKVKIICPKHGEFSQEPRIHLSGKGCYECGGKRKITQDRFQSLCKDVFGDSIIFDHINYISHKDYIYPICPIHGEFKIRTDRFLSGHSCQFCSNRKLTTDLFIEYCNKEHNNKYDYTLVKYINNRIPVYIICPIHGVFSISPSLHLSGYGCRKCSLNDILNKNKKSFINLSKRVHSNKYDYSDIDYINNYTNINITCPKHGVFSQIPNNHLNGAGCPLCNQSKGELTIYNYLKSNNIKFIYQYKFDNCVSTNKLIFDFYLPDYNMCIEYNGKQHYEPNSYFGGIESFKKQIYNDDIKKRYCKENNINLKIIRYDHILLDEISDIKNNIKTYDNM